jgi:hypothetical protein
MSSERCVKEESERTIPQNVLAWACTVLPDLNDNATRAELARTSHPGMRRDLRGVRRTLCTERAGAGPD